jgi:hypothetical protein
MRGGSTALQNAGFALAADLIRYRFPADISPGRTYDKWILQRARARRIRKGNDKMREIKLGIGFATGRKSFKKVLSAYMYNWNNTVQELPEDLTVRLSLFVSYDLKYRKTQSTDYTNLSQDIVDTFENTVFLGAKNVLKSINMLKENDEFTHAEIDSIFGAGYAGKRNQVMFAAIENGMDYLLFLDDDEYPMAVTNNRNRCIWSGEQVLLEHLKEIETADYTNGYHCGYVSPIPQITFNKKLSEETFRTFIGAISNDIINWDSIKKLMKSGGVTYASTDILQKDESHDVPLNGGCKFISGANLCVNLTQLERTQPFFNPPGARGEDTFLSTMLKDRTVRRIPCYTFHDGFSIYQHLLSGVLPIRLAPITAGSPGVNSRFLSACIGWVRYKPLLVYITQREEYEQKMAEIRNALSQTLPELAEYFGDSRFLKISDEFEKYSRNVGKHFDGFLLTQRTWKKMMDVLAQQ